MTLGALILAGGKSSRMGRDKALLEIDGVRLLQRQLELVRRLKPDELFVSYRPEAELPEAGFRLLLDKYKNLGPLAGVESGLAATRCSHLLVLAVDLPRMDAGYLQTLLNLCDGPGGLVPLLQGRAEPLSAIYPKEAHSIALDMLERGDCAAHRFVSACNGRGLLRMHVVAKHEEHLFENWNSPEDIPAAGR